MFNSIKRANKGEKYWCVTIGCDGLTVSHLTETNCLWDYENHKINNYFHTKEEAEAMAEKIHKVLNGADVIEMPSEKEIENAMNESVTDSTLCVAPYDGFTQRANILLECAWMSGMDWLKSRIVK